MIPAYLATRGVEMNLLDYNLFFLRQQLGHSLAPFLGKGGENSFAVGFREVVKHSYEHFICKICIFESFFDCRTKISLIFFVILSYSIQNFIIC